MEYPPVQILPALSRSQAGLDWLNFFVADVETGFGPFVSLYLASSGWSQGAIGSVLTLNTAVALATQIPAGALIDWTRRKRPVVAVCLLLIAAGAVLIAASPTPAPVVAGELLHGLTGGTLAAAITGIALGLVGSRAFHTRVGRNYRYGAIGNALTAFTMGGLGAMVSLRAPLLVAAALTIPALYCLSWIRPGDIDDRRARSSSARGARGLAWRNLLRNRQLRIFAASLFLFQAADASLLPLATEQLASRGPTTSSLITAALIVLPQMASGLIAAWVARKADSWGRRSLLMLGFASLVLRATLFALGPSEWFLVAIQLVGGLTAAVIGILTPLVVADVTSGSGRYNAALGATTTVGSIGAAISTTAIGLLAQEFGFVPAFASLAVIALLGLGLLAWQFPETRRPL